MRYSIYEVHTHPEPEQIENQTLWSDIPSPDDIAGSIGKYPCLVLGYDASSFKSIAFYHKNGQIGDSI